MTNFWTECSPFGIAFSLALSITAAESQTSALRLPAPAVVTGVQTNRKADKLYSTRTHVHAHFLSTSHAWNLCKHCLFFSFLSAALSLKCKHTQRSELFIEHLWVGVGGTMAALLHQAQTRSQINILSPAGQLVQAGLSASEGLSPGFHIKEREKKKNSTQL